MPLMDKTQLKDRLHGQGFFGSSLKCDLAYFQQTHLGPDGKPLKVTGELDEDTQWAIKHPSGEAQRSHLDPKIPRGLGEERNAVLTLALEEHAKDVKERPNGSNRSKEIDKYFPQWLQNKLQKGEKGPAWCAFFVNWVYTQICEGRPWGGYIGSCKRLVTAAKKSSSCHVFSNPEEAAPGDLFVILHGNSGHIGIVLRKDKKSLKINTIEGNCGNRVKVGLRETADLTCFIRVFPKVEKFSVQLLAVADVGKEGTR